MENYFAELYRVNVSDKVEKKNGLSYLSWAFAWAEVKKRHPDASYTVYERPDGIIYWTDDKTCWVKTGVTIEGLEHIEYLPIMDVRNRSIPVDAVTSMDVNKAIQRSLTKAAARHGLGLYIYAGEDLPEGEEEPEPITSQAGKGQRATILKIAGEKKPGWIAKLKGRYGEELERMTGEEAGKILAELAKAS